MITRTIRLLAFDTDFWFHPVPCGASRPTVARSDLAGWASYGYCASRTANRPGLVLITDKGFSGRATETLLNERGIDLLRPARSNGKQRWGAGLLKPTRHLTESVNDTLKGQLDLEEHGGRTLDGVAVRVAHRIQAMTAAI